MPPNTDHAHNKHIWSIICNFNQVQVITPWWWIPCDPKHVGVIFNVCLLDFYTTQILTSTTVIIEGISWSIKVTYLSGIYTNKKFTPLNKLYCVIVWQFQFTFDVFPLLSNQYNIPRHQQSPSGKVIQTTRLGDTKKKLTQRPQWYVSRMWSHLRFTTTINVIASTRNWIYIPNIFQWYLTQSTRRDVKHLMV
jgi:hypothetical protein